MGQLRYGESFHEKSISNGTAITAVVNGSHHYFLLRVSCLEWLSINDRVKHLILIEEKINVSNKSM